MNILSRLRRIVCLYFYYKAKKKGVVSDIVVPVWMAQLSKKDVGNFRIRLNVNGVPASLMVVRVDEFGFFCKNVHLNLEFIKDYKYVSQCSYKEFVEYYGDICMYLWDNEGKVAIS